MRKSRYTKLPIKIKKTRQKNVLWSKVKKATTLLLLFAVIYGLLKGYQFITTSKIFKVNVRCVNAPNEMKNKYLEVINIICEDNFFLFSNKKLKKDLLVAFPEIKDVKVKKVFPNKIYIEFVFREPIGSIVMCNTTKYIDENGVIFETTHSTDLPEISTYGDKKGVCNLIFWLKSKYPNFYQNIKKVISHENKYITFILKDGVEVLWDDEDKDLRESKILAYNLVMEKIKSESTDNSPSLYKKSPKTIDLRYYPNGDVPVRFF